MSPLFYAPHYNGTCNLPKCTDTACYFVNTGSRVVSIASGIVNTIVCCTCTKYFCINNAGSVMNIRLFCTNNATVCIDATSFCTCNRSSGTRAASCGIDTKAFCIYNAARLIDKTGICIYKN
jgi:hypothetical protein